MCVFSEIKGQEICVFTELKIPIYVFESCSYLKLFLLGLYTDNFFSDLV